MGATTMPGESEPKTRITTKTKLFYALGDFPFSFSATLIGFFLMIYLTNTIGISAFWAGAIIFIGIVWDAVTDPIAGYLNDNAASPLGRRRKYIILFLVPLAMRGVKYRPIGASGLLRRNLLIYGGGGVIVPFVGIKLIDMALTLVGVV